MTTLEAIEKCKQPKEKEQQWQLQYFHNQLGQLLIEEDHSQHEKRESQKVLLPYRELLLIPS